MRLVRYSSLLIAVMSCAVETEAQQTPQSVRLPPFEAGLLASPQELLSPEVEPAWPSSLWQPPAAAAAASPPSTGVTDEALPAPTAGGGAKIGNDLGDAAGAGVVCEEPQPWYRRPLLLVPLPWDTGIELGLNGSTGTSDSFSLRTGGYINRESRFSKLDLSTYYNRTSSGGVRTQNNAQFDLRNDWLLDEKSPWTLFLAKGFFYDEFKNFDLQTNMATGVGYRFYHEKDLQLIGRVGGGTSREFGGPDDRWVPESLVGIEYSQQLTQTQKFYGKLDYFPEWDQVGEYRMVADTGWEVVLIQPSNLSFKISATDRYDSTPNGAEPHLVNYSVLLLLKL